jgi:hypothetical protein
MNRFVIARFGSRAIVAFLAGAAGAAAPVFCWTSVIMSNSIARRSASADLLTICVTNLDVDSASPKPVAEFRCRSVANPVPAHRISAVTQIARITSKKLISHRF